MTKAKSVRTEVLERPINGRMREIALLLIQLADYVPLSFTIADLVGYDIG